MLWWSSWHFKRDTPSRCYFTKVFIFFSSLSSCLYYCICIGGESMRVTKIAKLPCCPCGKVPNFQCTSCATTGFCTAKCADLHVCSRMNNKNAVKVVPSHIDPVRPLCDKKGCIHNAVLVCTGKDCCVAYCGVKCRKQDEQFHGNCNLIFYLFKTFLCLGQVCPAQNPGVHREVLYFRQYMASLTKKHRQELKKKHSKNQRKNQAKKEEDSPSDECMICMEEGADEPLPCINLHPYRVHGNCMDTFKSYSVLVRCLVCGV